MRWRLRGWLLGGLLLPPLLFVGSAKFSRKPIITPPAPATVVSDHAGQALRIFADAQGVHRYLTDSEAVDPFYLQALTAYEDQRYWQHSGVDWLAFARALVQWARNGRVISGASTLSMQTARLIWPYRRTVLGKLEQMWRALQLEAHYSKADILSEYLNRAPFGGTLEGVEAAARRYFGRSANTLSGPQAALLVVLPQKPTRYRPDLHPEAALAARNKVIRRLASQGRIEADTARRWQAASLGVHPQPHPLSAPLLARRLRQQYPHSAEIRTTLRAELQQRLERLLLLWRDQAKRGQSAAVLVTDNQSGAVLAYAGSADFLDRERFGHVDMVSAIRSPGSTLKPFIYAQAIDRGLIHEASLLTDVPRDFNGYHPQNFDGRYRGAISARRALQSSRNVPAVQVLKALRSERLIEAMRGAELHLKGADNAKLSLALGGVGANLQTLVRAYMALAREGRVPTLRWRREQPEQWRPWLSPEAAWITWQMLSAKPPSGITAHTQRPRIAWKTGTSYGFRDAWALGVSARHTVGVWTGRPDGSPIVGAMGLQESVPLLFDVFDLLPTGPAQVKRPEGVTQQVICWPGGRRRNTTRAEACLRQKTAWTKRGIAPPTLYDSAGEPPHGGWPQALLDWQNSPAPQTRAPAPLAIQSLHPGQTLFRRQQLRWPLHSNRRSPVSWYVNGEYVEVPWLDLGRYPNGPLKLVVADESGQYHAIEITLAD